MSRFLKREATVWAYRGVPDDFLYPCCDAFECLFKACRKFELRLVGNGKKDMVTGVSYSQEIYKNKYKYICALSCCKENEQDKMCTEKIQTTKFN